MTRLEDPPPRLRLRFNVYCFASVLAVAGCKTYFFRSKCAKIVYSVLSDPIGKGRGRRVSFSYSVFELQMCANKLSSVLFSSAERGGKGRKGKGFMKETRNLS